MIVHTAWCSRNPLFQPPQLAMHHSSCFLFDPRWVALNLVCTEYMDHIKRTQRELYNHIRECPTYEQAKRDIGYLAKTFLADVETAQKELAEKRKEGEEERMELEAPSTA